MTDESYIKINKSMLMNPRLKAIVLFLDKTITIVSFCSYIVFVIFQLIFVLNSGNATSDNTSLLQIIFPNLMANLKGNLMGNAKGGGALLSQSIIIKNFAKTVLIPLFGFVSVSLFRKIINKPRPYERLAIAAIGKVGPKKGCSFPSRHVFSIFMLAETYLYAVSDPIAFMFYFGGILLAVCRVMRGLHHLADVLVGAMVALLFGLLYYAL